MFDILWPVCNEYCTLRICGSKAAGRATVMRRIAVITGSESDYWQCIEGLQCLEQAAQAGLVEITGRGALVSSIHRNTDEILGVIMGLSSNNYIWRIYKK